MELPHSFIRTAGEISDVLIAPGGIYITSPDRGAGSIRSHTCSISGHSADGPDSNPCLYTCPCPGRGSSGRHRGPGCSALSCRSATPRLRRPQECPSGCPKPVPPYPPPGIPGKPDPGKRIPLPRSGPWARAGTENIRATAAIITATVIIFLFVFISVPPFSQYAVTLTTDINRSNRIFLRIIKKKPRYFQISFLSAHPNINDVVVIMTDTQGERRVSRYGFSVPSAGRAKMCHP